MGWGGGVGSYRSRKSGGQGLSCKDGGRGCKVLKKLWGGGGLREVTRLEGRVLVMGGGGGQGFKEVGGCEGLIGFKEVRRCVVGGQGLTLSHKSGGKVAELGDRVLHLATRVEARF